jgi:hypothetical protein
MPTRATWPFGAIIAARPSAGTESIQKAEVAAMVLFPKFDCEEEAFMGCANHPVEPEIRFLDGRTERFVVQGPSGSGGQQALLGCVLADIEGDSSTASFVGCSEMAGGKLKKAAAQIF